MDAPRYSLTLLVLTMIIPFFAIQRSTSSIPQNNHNRLRNCSSSCGNIQEITFPFRLETDPINCGSYFDGYKLSCKKNRTIFRIKNQEYNVQATNYNNYTIRVASPDVVKENCSSVPRSSLSVEDVPQNAYSQLDAEFHFGKVREIPESIELPSCKKSNCSAIPLFSSLEVVDSGYFTRKTYPKLETIIRVWPVKEIRRISEALVFLSCARRLLNNPTYVHITHCINNNMSLFPGNNEFFYAVYGNGFKFSDIEESCQIHRTTLVSSPSKKIGSYVDVHADLVHGFELSWVQAFQESWHDPCYVDEHTNAVRCPVRVSVIELLREMGGSILVYVKQNMPVLLGKKLIETAFVFGLVLYLWKRRHRSAYDGIEAFLQSSNNLMPLRYTYSEIKKMAQGFETKLGQGGFGSVYRGRLHNGRFAAIKILSRSQDNGQDFMNEVATIGRIHHVNVVRLIGFCVEGSKRALVYEFMPNGSLDKFIFSGDQINSSLSSKMLFEISLGVARGIEYLHQGCDMQILHFDIKPHNILLDENFVPKVSDFGLARLCPLGNSVVSLTAARGTIGYMAPELFYKNIGGVSHKSDVYSFGMLLMEMANKRRNVNAMAENSSQIFLPLSVYDQLTKEEALKQENNVAEEELETTRKMVIVALWCIQLRPSDRPSMKEVIEMLEGNVECLEMPPKPYLYPREENNAEERSTEDAWRGTTSSLSLREEEEEESAEISLISNAY